MGNLPIMLLALFLRGIQSSCYSPSKFGMLPEILPERLLSWGNGVIELGSFMAIIAGTVAGTTLYSKFSGQLGYAGLILFAVTLVGVAVSVTLPRVPAAGNNKAVPDQSLWRTVGRVEIDPQGPDVIPRGARHYLLLHARHPAAAMQSTITGLLSLMPVRTRTGYLLAAIGIGIGIGSLAAGYLSGGKIEYGLIPLGAAGMTMFSVLFSSGPVVCRGGGVTRRRWVSLAASLQCR